MMDIQQFEGHAMNGDYQVWSWSKDAMKKMESVDQFHSTAALLNAAPHLLAEVKQLREWKDRVITYLGNEEMYDFYDWIKEKYGDEEE